MSDYTNLTMGSVNHILEEKDAALSYLRRENARLTENNLEAAKQVAALNKTCDLCIARKDQLVVTLAEKDQQLAALTAERDRVVNACAYAADAIKAWMHWQRTTPAYFVEMADLPLVEKELRKALASQPPTEEKEG